MTRRMQKIADEMVTAYVDGVLNAADAAKVEAAMAADPALAAKVVRQRQLRRQRSSAGASADPKVIRHDFRKPRTPVAPPAPPRPALRPPAWLLVAAGLIVGVVVLQAMGIMRSAPLATSPVVGQPARGALAIALDRKLSGEPGLVLVERTFPDRNGGLCRSFRIDADAGIACRQDRAWLVRMTAKAGGEGLPATVGQAVGRMALGQPLDRAQETAARDAGWK